MAIIYNIEEDIRFKQGVIKGKEVGIIEGIIEGEKRGLLEGIADLLEVKFGEEGLKLMKKIKEIKELSELERVRVSIKKAKDISEVKV